MAVFRLLEEFMAPVSKIGLEILVNTATENRQS